MVKEVQSAVRRVRTPSGSQADPSLKLTYDPVATARGSDTFEAALLRLAISACRRPSHRLINNQTAAKRILNLERAGKPAPPRIKMFIGFADLPAAPNALSIEPARADTPGTNPKPAVPPAMAESFKNSLLFVVIPISS